MLSFQNISSCLTDFAYDCHSLGMIRQSLEASEFLTAQADGKALHVAKCWLRDKATTKARKLLFNTKGHLQTMYCDQNRIKTRSFWFLDFLSFLIFATINFYPGIAAQHLFKYRKRELRPCSSDAWMYLDTSLCIKPKATPGIFQRKTAFYGLKIRSLVYFVEAVNS